MKRILLALSALAVVTLQTGCGEKAVTYQADIKPILEINGTHPLVARLHDEQNEQRFNDWSHILLDQAALAEGTQLDDPVAFVARLNQLLLLLPK